ncbi:hypothetical protein [uncultured Jannaschia sp.]|uniref:hypothetical protein n=1 Tax=uncultured Jannaschia sp. TaxID=293347 RepID=UPI0026075989|nr:hypothetical protein [uncultured Jannaschia sp.]
MDPTGLSLMAISATSIALRRYSDMSRDDVPAFPAHRIDGPPRASAIERLRMSGLRIRSLVDVGRQAISRRLGRFAAGLGLELHAQVSLAGIIEAPGDPAVEAILRGRRLDYVLSDEYGLPLCGIALVSGPGPAYRDSVCQHALALVGLPLVTVSVRADWAETRARLTAALNLEPPAANDRMPIIVREALPMHV